MIKYVKYYLILWGARMPIVLGILALIFLWFIREPYYSNMNYLASTVICFECDRVYATNDKFCQYCGSPFSDSASVKTLAHCNYCNTNKLYRNGAEYCEDCGRGLEEEQYVPISELGYTSVKNYRNAKMIDNLQRVINHKIFISFLIVVLSNVFYRSVKQIIKRAALRKIINDSLDCNREIK